MCTDNETDDNVTEIVLGAQQKQIDWVIEERQRGEDLLDKERSIHVGLALCITKKEEWTVGSIPAGLIPGRSTFTFEAPVETFQRVARGSAPEITAKICAVPGKAERLKHVLC